MTVVEIAYKCRCDDCGAIFIMNESIPKGKDEFSVKLNQSVFTLCSRCHDNY